MSSFNYGHNRRICLICDREQIFLDPDSIVMLTVKKRQLKIHMADGQVYTCYGTLKEFGQKLDNRKFFRSHKSYLVNMDYIKLVSIEYGEREIEFDCIRERAVLSRRKMKVLKELIT